ncbi:MAG TPA: class I SAM-dependent RNA methyltransferase [Edaphocola sp.]|nr:class I SAM-dependent RNA methyltransferase [Edaphocola sp.]
MIDFNKTGDITITCQKNIADALALEVRALGFQVKEKFLTGLTLKGSLNDCIKLNLNLYCASQILYKIKSFTANSADEVYEQVAAIDWSKIMDAEDYFSIKSNVFHPRINNSMFANLRVKDAIVDQFRTKTGKRPNTGADLKGLVVHLHWKNENAAIYLDTSGNSLGRHGYRKFPGKAPMLESLAAATILSTKWNKKSAFVNPMCGSGTLAIEACLIATNRKPGLFRTHYAFMHIKGYDEQVYFKEDSLLEEQILDLPELKIIASDLDPEAVVTAQKNAIAAGVKDLIHFEVCDFRRSTIPNPEKGSVVFLNPEYGDRLGLVKELEEVYSGIGDFFKQKCRGYTGYVFTGNSELARKVNLKAERKIPFYNAKIECRLLEFELYKGSKPGKDLR